MCIRTYVDVPSLDSIGSSSLEEFSRKHYGHLPPWEKKLVAAQNVLFNQELFTTVSTTIAYNIMHTSINYINIILGVFFFFSACP